MTIKSIGALISQAIQEIRNEKICLIEDIFKVYRTLYGTEVNVQGYDIHKPGDKFDELYDLTIEQLEMELAIRSAQVSRRFRFLAGIDVIDDSN